MRRIRLAVCSAQISRIGTFGLAIATVLVTFFAAELPAQLPQTRLSSIFPPGGQAGTTLELKLTSGTDLDEVDRLYFNHAGLKAAPKMRESGGKKFSVTNTFLVSIDENVPPGLYEVRAAGLFGMSNPRTFVVGDREESREKEGNNTPAQAAEIKLNQVVNGSVGGADIDYFKFDGKQGQRIIATCLARRIDSRLTATLEVYDSNGRRLGFGRDNVRRDPLVDISLPADGTYFVKLYDSVYGGGNEYTYRLSVGTAPHIDFVIPISGLPGSTGKYTLYGRNLPGGVSAGVTLDGRPLEKLEVSISLPQEGSTLQSIDHLTPVESGIDAISYVHQSPSGNSNPVLIYLATAPVVVEHEPNDHPAQSQNISVPAEFVGQFQAVGDEDYVNFEAKSQEIYYIEVFGQRCGTTVDPLFVLYQITKNDAGVEQVKQLTRQDDNGENLAGNLFDTNTDDPIYRFQIPADGTYRIVLRDNYFETRGSPNLVYRLSIRKEQPDFRLISLPKSPLVGNANTYGAWSIGLRKGDNFLVDVMVFRRDGYDGTIEVSAEGLPKGVTCIGARLGPKQSRAPLIFTAAEDAPEWAGSIRVVGKGRIEDREKIKAETAAQSEVKAATNALTKLDPPLTKVADTLQQAQQALQKSETESKKNLDDKGLKGKVEQAKKAVAAAEQKLKKATDAKTTGQKKLAAAQAALKKAQDHRQAAAQDVIRPARFATIVWNAGANIPALSRLARTLGLSVLKEKAPFQVTTEVARVEVNQGRQILVPVKLAKRDGFDNNVTLTFTGIAKNTNIQVTNKPIDKGKNEQLLRIFVNNNAMVGNYTVYLKTKGQVAYRRNLPLVERTKTAQAEAAQVLQTAKTAAEKVVQQRNAANKKADETFTALKKVQAAKAAAEKRAAKAEAASKQAEKKAAQAKAAAKKAADELAAAVKVFAVAEAASKTAAEAKAQAENRAKQAEKKSKTADAAKKVADKRASDAANAAKPKNIDIAPPSTPIIIRVKRGPATFGLSVPNGGALKRGAKTEVKVTLKRINGFQGPVTLRLPHVPGVKGVTAEAVTVPADKNEGVLVIQAAGDATLGTLPNLVVRGTMQFEGQAAVDSAITLKVSK